ncbi:M48 family metallopeptidase [Desulfoscipio gibsoniae]
MKDSNGKLVFVLPRLVLDDRVMEYTVKRSHKALSLKITVDAKDGVTVTAPEQYNTGVVKRFIQDKSVWIIEKLDYLSVLSGCPVPRSFADGEQFFFLGNQYTVKVHINEQVMNGAVRINGRQMLIDVPLPLYRDNGAAAVRDTLVKWYKTQANYTINDRIDFYIKGVGVKPAKIRIKEQKHRWGSCSGKGNLNFNWHLVMAPIGIIDYIVVHELCHLLRLDHSPAFWSLVGAVLPDYPTRRRWLKQYGPVLTF